MRCWFEGAAKLAIPLMEIGLLFSILLALGGASLKDVAHGKLTCTTVQLAQCTTD